MAANDLMLFYRSEEMKTNFPPAAMSLLIGMLVPLLVIIGTELPSVLLKDILFFLPTTFLLAGLPSLLLAAIANSFLTKSGASDRALMFTSIAIGVAIGILAVIPVLITGGQ